MKIQFIYPEFPIYFTYEAPIGIAYLKAIAEGKGHKVGVLDNNALHKPMEEVLEAVKGADLVGLSVSTPALKTASDLCKEIKKNYDIPIIVGGPHPTIDPEACLEFSDYVVVGEGEETFAEFLDVFEKGADRDELKKVKGLAFTENGKPHFTPPREINNNLDSLPFPSWSGYPLESYGSALRVSGRSLPIVTSRGCPYNCIYCFKGLFGVRYRTRSAKNVVEELKYLKKKFGIKEFQIADDSFSLLQKRAVDICKEMVKNNINLPWSLPNGIRADTITEELCFWMKKSGLQYTGLGIESGNQEMLDRIGKSQTKEQVVNAVRLLKKHKIQVVGFFMFGLPGETKETIRESLKFAKQLDLDYYSISMTTPYPGTRLYDELKKGKGKLLVEKPEDLFSLGSNCKYTMPGMASPEEIEKEYRRARISLLLRPKTIIKTLKSPKRIIAGVKVAYKWILKT